MREWERVGEQKGLRRVVGTVTHDMQCSCKKKFTQHNIASTMLQACRSSYIVLFVSQFFSVPIGKEDIPTN